MFARSSSCALLALAWLALAACTGDDEIYATPRVSPIADAATTSSSSGGAASSSSGSVGLQDGSAGTDGSTDGATNEGGLTDGGDASTTNDAGIDSGVDSGPVVCSLVACAGNATCSALGCGSCNMGLGVCKP